MKRMLSLLCILLLASVALADQAPEVTQENVQWPDDLPLPKWQTPQELLVPPEATDDVTPPPTEPVRAVAEFEPQEGVQLAYPFGYNDMFVDMVRECQEVGVVYMVVENTASMSSCVSLLQSNGVPINNIEFIFHPMDAMWSRDYGPHFIWGETSGEIALLDWQYYDSRPNDDEIPDYMADQWHMNFYETPMYHEGGNYMSDGHGQGMATNVIYERNGSWTQAEVRQEMSEYFGLHDLQVYQKITWDATGHIDLWAKMVNDTTILVARMQPNDPNYNLVEQHAAAMAQVNTVYGTPFNIQRVQMPPAYTWIIWHYYKSFMNSLIFNGKVLVPIFNTEVSLSNDAIAAYQAAMPDYEIVGIYSDAICSAGGAIHCTTIGIAEHSEDYIYNTAVNVTPVGAPVIIPQGGGSFDFDAELINSETDSIFTEVWSEVTLPSGGVVAPLFERDITMATAGSLSRTLSQNVPGTAPAGTYTYTLYTGERLPRVINDEASFTFVKEGVAGDAREDLTGWWVEEVDGSADLLDAGIVQNYAMVEAYPNPFNPTTALTFTVDRGGLVNLAVYNAQGAKVKELFEGYRSAGRYQIDFDATGLASGVYFAKLQTAASSVMQKLVFMK